MTNTNRQGAVGGILAAFLVIYSACAPALDPAAKEQLTSQRMSGPAKLTWSSKMDLALSTLPGQPTRLSAYKKKVTLLSLWALYCAPCLVELPYVDALYRKFQADADVAVLSINEDELEKSEDASAIRAQVALHKLEVPVLLDKRRETEALVKKAFKVPSLMLPLILVLRDNKLVFAADGGFRITETEEDFIASYSALIEQARAGADELRLPAPASATAKTGSNEFTFPWVKRDIFEQQVPLISKFLAMFFSRLTEEQRQAMLDEVRAAVMRGEAATFHPPLSPTPTATPTVPTKSPGAM